jgi:hypothetical protein
MLSVAQATANDVAELAVDMETRDGEVASTLTSTVAAQVSALRVDMMEADSSVATTVSALRSTVDEQGETLRTAITEAVAPVSGNVDLLSTMMSVLRTCMAQGQQLDASGTGCTAPPSAAVVLQPVASTPECSAANKGTLTYDASSKAPLRLCDGDGFLRFAPAMLGSEGHPAQDCGAIKAKGMANGFYYIGDDEASAERAYCRNGLEYPHFPPFDRLGEPLAYFPFDDGTSDAMGRLTTTVTGTALDFDGAGILGNAARFGGNTWVDLPTLNPAILNRPFTFAGWFHITDTERGRDNAIFCQGASVANQGLHIVERVGRAYFGFWANDLTTNLRVDEAAWVWMERVIDCDICRLTHQMIMIFRVRFTWRLFLTALVKSVSMSTASSTAPTLAHLTWQTSPSSTLESEGHLGMQRGHSSAPWMISFYGCGSCPIQCCVWCSSSHLICMGFMAESRPGQH